MQSGALIRRPSGAQTKSSRPILFPLRDKALQLFGGKLPVGDPLGPILPGLQRHVQSADRAVPTSPDQDRAVGVESQRVDRAVRSRWHLEQQLFRFYVPKANSYP